ncbi:hypothetical protein GCM10010442_29940 [Kitasatospora kifunensis]
MIRPILAHNTGAPGRRPGSPPARWGKVVPPGAGEGAPGGTEREEAAGRVRTVRLPSEPAPSPCATLTPMRSVTPAEGIDAGLTTPTRFLLTSYL